MDILLFILVTGAVIVGIVWATDIPTSKWMFHYTIDIGQKKPLWRILHDCVTQENEEEARIEAKAPATTYTEAFKRMQDRETARINKQTSKRNPS